MTTLERRVKGLEHRLAELSGEREERLEQLTSEIAQLREDVRKILDLLQDRA